MANRALKQRATQQLAGKAQVGHQLLAGVEGLLAIH
jgi:hypothetical protein